jgi:O-antigen/teichoic acid export membrane protein
VATTHGITESKVSSPEASGPRANGPAPLGIVGTVLRNSAWSTFAVVAQPILQFLFGGLTIRYLGMDSMGFSLTVGAVLSLAGRFGTCGVGEAALPAIASSMGCGDEHRVRRLIGVVLVVFGFSSVSTAVALYFSARPLVEWSGTTVATSTAVSFIAISCLSHVLGQMSHALMTVLRAAGRYDLVTMITTPTTFVTGIVACVVVPLVPSLITVALVGLVSAVSGLLLAVLVSLRSVPGLDRPLAGLGELPTLARYGSWLVLTHALAALTGGVDDLMIAGSCGAASLPPWAIAKRLWLAAHTFLAQHAEHLIPTLGSLRTTARSSFDSVSNAMHWYVVLLAAVGYAFMAWAGEAIVSLVAGSSVAALCQPPMVSFSLYGIFLSLLIIPIIAALAEGASRPAFIVSLLANSAQIAAVYGLSLVLGAPSVYYAPLAAIPALLLAMGTTSSRLFECRSAWSRIQPVAVPLVIGVLGVVSSAAAPIGMPVWHRIAAGGVLAVVVFMSTIGVERFLSINTTFHLQLTRVVKHVIDGVARVTLRGRIGFTRKQPPPTTQQVTP